MNFWRVAMERDRDEILAEEEVEAQSDKDKLAARMKKMNLGKNIECVYGHTLLLYVTSNRMFVMTNIFS